MRERSERERSGALLQQEVTHPTLFHFVLTRARAQMRARRLSLLVLGLVVCHLALAAGQEGKSAAVACFYRWTEKKSKALHTRARARRG